MVRFYIKATLSFNGLKRLVRNIVAENNLKVAFRFWLNAELTLAGTLKCTVLTLGFSYYWAAKSGRGAKKTSNMNRKIKKNLTMCLSDDSS